MSRPSVLASRAPRGMPASSGFPVFDGCAPASKRAKSRLRAASHGRLPVGFATTSGASMATRHRPSTYGASAATIVSSVGLRRQVDQVAVGVEHRQPRGSPLAPREVDADEVHEAPARQPTSSGRAPVSTAS